MDKRIFMTEYQGIITALDVPTSKMYSIKTGEIEKEKFEKFIIKQNNKFINCERKAFDKIMGISIGCANTCNLACSYCYANAGTYNNRDRKIMGVNDYNKLYDYLKKFDYPILNITFFGGEPLLSYDGIKDFVFKIEKDYWIRFKCKPQFSIVTNGTLIDEEIARFINEHFAAISISIDGPEKICNLTRIATNPMVSVYELIEKALYYINNLSERNFHLRALATLVPETLKEIKEYGVRKYRNSFFDLGFDSVAFFPATGIDWEECCLNDLNNFYYEIIDDTFNKIINGNLEHLDDMTMSYLVDLLKKHYNGDCVAGKNYLFYTPDGQVYPCQMYYNERKSTNESIKRYKLSKCADCPVINVCQSFCAGTSLEVNKSENIPIDYLCKVEKARFEYIIQRYGYEVYYAKSNKENYKLLIDTIKNYAYQNAASKRYGEI